MPPRRRAPQEHRLKLLVCDLDGTLVHSGGEISSVTVDALCLARRSGVEIVIATGRRHTFAQRVLASAHFDPGTVLISSNGAVVRTLAGETLHKTVMPAHTARSMCRHLNGFHESLIFTFDRAGHGSLVVEDVDALHLRIPGWVRLNRDDIAACTPLEGAFAAGEEPIQAMICGAVREMEQATEMLAGKSPGAVELRSMVSIHLTKYTARDLCIVDFLPVGCSKGSAVAWLAARRGLRATQVAAIGDNMNDADMLAFAGRAYIMGNSAEELRTLAAERGWARTGGNDEDGAAQAILRMLEEKPESIERKSLETPAVAG